MGWGSGGGGLGGSGSAGGGGPGGGWPGAASLKGTGARGPPKTYTGVPDGTVSKNHNDADMGMRTQPCETGVPGTDVEPWMAMPPLTYRGL